MQDQPSTSVDMSNKTTGSRVDLSGFDSALGYNAGAGVMKKTLWYLVKMFFFLSAFPFPYSFKSFLLRCFGAKVGKGLVIKPRVNIHMPWKLSIGDNVWIGEEALLLNFEQLLIGNNVCISQRSFLCGGNHDFKNSSMPYRNGPITLGDGCWIGAMVFISPNITVEKDVVVTAGSVVTTDLNANGIYKGNPASFYKVRW